MLFRHPSTMTPFPPPNFPVDVKPAEYSNSVWESLPPFLRFHGYRLITQRDVASDPVEWASPAQDDDCLYCPFFTGAIFQGFRLSDSQEVIFKIIDTSKGDEVRILSYLKQCESTTSRGLHQKVVPILEIIEVTTTLSIAVTEEWGIFCNYYDGSPETWEEFAEFACQVLEGLAFLHAHRIAHLDVSSGNILPSPPWYPHPHRLYSFIDFGQSFMFASSESCFVKGDHTTHKAPEMSKVKEYDAFKADVWQMGDFLSLALALAAEEYSFNVEGLPALLAKMKHPVPAELPTAEEAFMELKVEGATARETVNTMTGFTPLTPL
ncbi:kinase-like domain-containing protein [Mycena metata]|uniref:Kinase-like domain-containing protein n=1 Tax=Mycena metata TaxID=1033252 RepID=A0AAD7N7N6_9AGAR|nr:kinase-like domain-containing protein [Mycena metata]